MRLASLVSCRMTMSSTPGSFGGVFPGARASNKNDGSRAVHGSLSHRVRARRRLPRDGAAVTPPERVTREKVLPTGYN